MNDSAPMSGLKVMRMPREVDIEITARCNLRCTYCYFFNNPAVIYRDLPKEEWLQFFDELGRLGVMYLNIAGGEPFIRPDLPELLEGVVRNRMRFSLLSNGSLITDEIAAYIARTGRCDSVQISVDGSCAKVHDIARGRGSFAGAVRGIRTLQRNGVNVDVRMTIHQHNINDLENTAHFLLEELELPSFSTNAAGYLGSCQRNAGELLLTTEERNIAMQKLVDLERRYPRRIAANAGPLAEAHMWPEMERARRDHAPTYSDRGYLTGCGCPSSRITVRSDGTIVPCSMLAHLELGRINRDSFQEVWQNHPLMSGLRERRNIPLTSFELCKDCDYAPYCTGNCPGLAYTLSGEVNTPSPDACLKLFLSQGGRLPDQDL